MPTMAIGASIILILTGSVLGQIMGQPDTEVFPMRKGTRWIYRGEVASQTSGKVLSTQLDWTMEVVDNVQRGRYNVALILGHPKDLTWYEKGRKPGCHILIAVDNTKFYLGECGPFASHERLILPEGDLTGLTGEERLILKFPLRQADTFGGDPERGPRMDGMYDWYVQAVRQTTLGLISGITPAKPRMEYVLTYRTNPDHEVDTYVPGIGLTAYVYSHHGTVSDVNVRLVDFQTPVPKPRGGTPARP